MISNIYEDNGIYALLIENSFEQFNTYKTYCDWTRNHSNGLKIIPINFNLRKFVIVEANVEILVHLTIGIPFHSAVMTRSLPPNLRGDFSPLGGVIVTFVQLVIPYSRPLRKPLKNL